MDVNDYKKVANACIWFDDKIMLGQVLKKCWHQGKWGDPGGKVEKGESVLEAVRRETYEETGVHINSSDFDFIDCFIFPKRKMKVFLFEVKRIQGMFKFFKNTEPTKQGDWQLFTKKEALRLNLMPSIEFYLKNLK